MSALEALFDRIVQRVNINLREFGFDVRPYVDSLVPFAKLSEFYGFYGISSQHPLDFSFNHSNLAGSYFLGKCRVTNSILYKSDIRGDELKKKGDVFTWKQFSIPLTRDEGIRIEDSFLIKTLVHNYSHDPEHPEQFPICNTISARYSNIHGSPMDGSFLGPFATVDLTTMNDCIVGAFSYIQAGEVNHLYVEPGTVWVRSPDEFNFFYRFPEKPLSHYIHFDAGRPPEGLFMDFARSGKKEFSRVFASMHGKVVADVPGTSSVDQFSVVRGTTSIGENVLVAQRAYLDDAFLGKGANVQENCFVINSQLIGFDVLAHGAKLYNVDLAEEVFVGFNAFVHGREQARISIGQGCIVMPHTIIDSATSLRVPARSLVWGLITAPEDLEDHCLSLDTLVRVSDVYSCGRMEFRGSGKIFVDGFKQRIHHILEENGAFFDGTSGRGHAQKNRHISYNTIQPYGEGELQGIFPTIAILP
jgi:carbonic anhydrase/acetyltransferase-like protein (isoleucine patch superfamily)